MAEPKTRAQACAAANAVFETRLIAHREGADRVEALLYRLEMKYWDLADQLSRPKPRKKR